MNSSLDEQTLMAFVDGELDPATRDRVAAAVTADPALARRVERERSLRERVRAEYDRVLEEPVPSALLAPIRATSRKSPGTSGRRMFTPLGGFAIAASLVIGVLLGHRLATTGSAALVSGDATGLIARGTLSRGLSNATAASGYGSVRVGLSFRSASGEYCRTFDVTGNRQGQAGLACHGADGDWHIRVLETLEPSAAPRGPMRQAGSRAMPESVRRAVEATIVGEPLDAHAEAAASAAGWAPTAPSDR